MQPPDQPASPTPGEPNPVPLAKPSAVPPPGGYVPPHTPPPGAGAPPPYPGGAFPEPPPSGPAGPLSSEEKNWALAAHMSALSMLLISVGVLGPLIVWLIQRDKMPFVNVHGKEAVNFQLTHMFVMLGLFLVSFVTCGFGLFITGPLMIADAIFALVMAVIAGLKAGNGEYYQYPLSWRIIK